MNTSITPSLDLRRKKKDGTFPLVLRLGHNQSTTTIHLKISLNEKDWDAKNNIIRKTYKGVESVTRLNNVIHKKKSEALDIIMELHEAGHLSLMSIAELREKIDNDKNTVLTFYSYADEQIEELKKAHRFGTARSYQGAISVLKKFTIGKELQFHELNYKFLTKFESYHASKGNSPNGLAVYMRAIRSLYNKAIKSGVVEKEHYPFSDYKIKSVPTEKRALEWSFLKKIIEKEIKPADECFNARNYFVSSYMMYGMNFTDMAFLKVSDIKDGRIQYRRKKTSKLYDIKITTNLEGILSYYRKTPSDFIFPIIHREESELQYRDILWARKRYNKQLKKLAILCDIEANLTSYVSRHSFATQAMLQQVPLNAISSMLGHSSLKTTEIYLKSLPSSILDDYNEKIMQG
ncbi:MAG: site-specific integrase [Bacteroidetes bacterium]|nr:site-specific integrase [Bacteroidota bacterium]